MDVSEQDYKTEFSFERFIELSIEMREMKKKFAIIEKRLEE